MVAAEHQDRLRGARFFFGLFLGAEQVTFNLLGLRSSDDNQKVNLFWARVVSP